MNLKTILAIPLFLACSSAPEVAPKSGELPVAEGLGGKCSGVGTGVGQIAAFPEHPDCTGTLCVADARGESLEAYCSVDCTKFRCPAGYTCEATTNQIDRVCTPNPAVCGDAILQRGEACDDGNTTGPDACSADCLTVNEPIATVRFDTLSVGGATQLAGAFPLYAADKVSTCNTMFASNTKLSGISEQVSLTLIACSDAHAYAVSISLDRRDQAGAQFEPTAVQVAELAYPLTVPPSNIKEWRDTSTSPADPRAVVTLSNVVQTAGRVSSLSAAVKFSSSQNGGLESALTVNVEKVLRAN